MHDRNIDKAEIVVTLNCGHKKDYTNVRRGALPVVGDGHSCWSSCDAAGRVTRTVTKIEVRTPD